MENIVEIGTPPTAKEQIAAMTCDWITTQMEDFGISNRLELSELAGISYESLVAAYLGTRELSGPIKSTLHWYFYYRAAMKDVQMFETFLA